MEFNDGITAVVGPNGSGKSNIGDAMRWVLGEQSSKTLRGGKMEDVIFGGTQLRKAQGFAQVQLTIDNKDRALAYDGDEVSILRKLYRSGESEYKINGISVRLRDVYELFMDTGLGRDGYSIIGQGKIAEIISAKAAQRREIFEEAAGISKYRYRKAEAQRRLEGAEENLLRLRDILTELESRVEPLRIQAEKAEQFLEYAGEKKTLEISLWVRTLEQSKEALRAQEDKLLLSRTEHDEIQEEIDRVEAEINDHGEQMRRLAVEIDDHRTQIRAIEERSAAFAQEVAVMKNDMAHNAASVAQMQAELARSGDSGEELRQKIHIQEQEILGKEQELDELRMQKTDLQQKLSELTAAQNACYKEIDSYKERRFALTQSINDAKLSSASSTSLIDETIGRLSDLKDGAVIKDENVRRIFQEQKDCGELLESIGENIASLQNTRQGYEMKMRGRQDKLEALMTERRSLEDKARERTQKAKLLFDMENSMEGFQNSVKFIMNKASSGALRGVHGPVSRLIGVGDEHALAIEIALGAALQNVVVEDEGVAKRAIGMLKDARCGRATFLPVSTVHGNRLTENWLSQMDGYVGLAAELVTADLRFSGIINQLLGRIVIVQDLDCATQIAKRGGYRFRVVTLDGQVVNTGGSMTGGYVAKSAGILSRAGEIEALKDQAKKFQEQIVSLDETAKGLREEVAAAQAALSGVDGELATAQEDRIRYEAEQRQLKTAGEDAVHLREQSAKEYDSLTARLQELRERNVSSADLIADMNRQLEEVGARIAERTEEREALTARSGAISEEISQQGMLALALEKETDGIRRMMAQLSDQQAGQEEAVDSLKRRIEDCETQNREIEARILEAQQNQESCGGEAAALSEAVAEKSKARDGHEAQAAALRQNEKEILSRRENAGRELARLEEKKAAVQAEYDGIISRLWEEYEITHREAEECAVPITDFGQSQRRLADLKNKIKGLGSVNVAALEEYKEVSGRYRFLKDQTDDAERSKVELIRLIDQLTMEMQRMFEEHFQLIAAHFSTIFVEMFGGGKGSLSLTDPSNILDSGIEINVQPPGKLIGNLAVLSGGEQALVAIAVYFAILKVRPSPFVLLDEIEAALDDVNVVKYAQYLRTICNRTQFIAITHRRGTMEEADILYGVTMQEEGVSKLLTLNVGELETKLGMK